MSDRMFLNQRKQSAAWIAVLIVAVAVFFGYSFLAIHGSGKFDSPDESANYFFASRIAAGLPTAAPLPAELQGQDLTHPRNAWVMKETVVPASFVGLIDLYGAIGRVMSVGVIPFLTPFFSALAIIAFFGFISRLWGSRIGFLSTLLLAVHPVFWYYAARGMFHNVLFFDLLILGAWFLAIATTMSTHRHFERAKSLVLFFIAGLSIGQALAVRTAELAWVTVGLLVAAWLLRKKLTSKFGLVLSILGLMVPIAILLAHNAQLFGSPFSFGYSSGLLERVLPDTAHRGWWSTLMTLILPFGLNIVYALSNGWKFGISLMWWLSLPMIAGLLLMIPRKPQPRALRVYWWMFIIMAAWLVAYYGSWALHDDPNPDAVTLGISYTRYWLPIYAFGLPFAAIWLSRMVGWVQRRSRSLSIAGVVAVGLGITSLSYGLVVTDSVQGLAVIRQHGVHYRQVADLVDQYTPPSAVIVSGRGDKFLFPDRNVIYVVENREEVRTVIDLMSRVPVYVYISPVESVAEVRASWSAQDLNLIDEQRLLDDGHLYRLEQAISDERS